ncbi:UNVERIFIED_CONTAM: hypothetical protein K2H54_021512 [Gekko kuhli]
MLQSPLLGLGEEDESDMTDWNLPLAFMKKRHCEKIEGSKSLAQSWRMKDRCINILFLPKLHPPQSKTFAHCSPWGLCSEKTKGPECCQNKDS